MGSSLSMAGFFVSTLAMMFFASQILRKGAGNNDTEGKPVKRKRREKRRRGEKKEGARVTVRKCSRESLHVVPGGMLVVSFGFGSSPSCQIDDDQMGMEKQARSFSFSNLKTSLSFLLLFLLHLFCSSFDSSHSFQIGGFRLCCAFSGTPMFSLKSSG